MGLRSMLVRWGCGSLRLHLSGVGIGMGWEAEMSVHSLIVRQQKMGRVRFAWDRLFAFIYA